MKTIILAAFTLLMLTMQGASAGVPSSGLKMGEYYCPHFNVACDRLYSESNNIVTAANECIADRLGISTPIMDHFNSSGANENCVTAGQTSVDAMGITEWAVCCVRRIEEDNACGLFCTRYATPK